MTAHQGERGDRATVSRVFDWAPRGAWAHTLTSMMRLASLLREMGRLDESEPLLQEWLAGRREVLGDKYPGTATCHQKIGFSVESQGSIANTK